jgi:uncharacterized protein YjbK
MRESELKFTLSDSEYKALVTAFLPHYVKSEVLWNNYYDTPDFVLDRAGYTVRLRLNIVDSQVVKAVVDLKHHQGVEGCLHIAEEMQFVIPWDYPVSMDVIIKGQYIGIFSQEQVGEIWTKIALLTNYHPAWLIGGIQVTRNTYHYKNLTLELDKIDYSDTITEYELECETENENTAYQVIRSLFQDYNIQLSPFQRGKRKRFLQLRQSDPRVGRTYNILRDCEDAN